MMPDGKLAVSTRRGEIWMIDNPTSRRRRNDHRHAFAHGLHEVLGLALARRLALRHAAAARSPRIKDEDGDGRADLFETVSDGWEINGDYHEYAFGSQVRQGRQHLGRALPDRFVQQQQQVSRLVPADHAGRQDDPDLQRRALARRHRHERRRATCSTPTTKAPGTARAASST